MPEHVDDHLDRSSGRGRWSSLRKLNGVVVVPLTQPAVLRRPTGDWCRFPGYDAAVPSGGSARSTGEPPRSTMVDTDVMGADGSTTVTVAVAAWYDHPGPAERSDTTFPSTVTDDGRETSTIWTRSFETAAWPMKRPLVAPMVTLVDTAPPWLAESREHGAGPLSPAYPDRSRRRRRGRTNPVRRRTP